MNKKFELFLILMVVFIDWMGIGLVYPMFSSMLFQHDCQIVAPEMSEAARGIHLGILLSIMPITLFFSAPILGALSDQKGRKFLINICLLVGVLGYLIAVVGVMVESLLILIISRIAIGISAGSGAVVEASLADLSTAEEKPKNFGLFNMACGLGFTAGPFIGGQLSTSSFCSIEGYAAPFLVAAMATFINLVLIIWFFVETHLPKEKRPISWTMGITNIKKAFALPGLRTVFFCVLFACVGWSFYWEFIPVTWINQLHFSTADVGDRYAFGAAIYALGSGLLIRPIVNRFAVEKVLFYGLIGCGLSIGVLLFHDSPTSLWVYIALQQYTISLFFPTSTALVSNSVGDEAQGEVLGVLQSVQAFAFAVSPLVAGVLLSLSFAIPIVVGAGSMLIAAGILGVFLKDKVFS